MRTSARRPSRADDGDRRRRLRRHALASRRVVRAGAGRPGRRAASPRRAAPPRRSTARPSGPRSSPARRRDRAAGVARRLALTSAARRSAAVSGRRGGRRGRRARRTRLRRSTAGRPADAGRGLRRARSGRPADRPARTPAGRRGGRWRRRTTEDMGRPMLRGENDEERLPEGGALRAKSGGVLLSQGVNPQVPSALTGLTSVFGMGTGVTLSLWPPKSVVNRCAIAH